MTISRGALATKKAIEAEGLTQNEAAAAVECDSGNFSKILQGKRNPGLLLGERIRKRFGTEIEWWNAEPLPDQPGTIAQLNPDDGAVDDPPPESNSRGAKGDAA